MDNFVLSAGFCIFIIGLAGLTYVNNIYLPEEAETASDFELGRKLNNALPFVIIVGITAMFLGYFEPFSQKEKETNNLHNINKKQNETTIEILNQRYVKGEISKEEFEQMKKDIK